MLFNSRLEILSQRCSVRPHTCLVRACVCACAHTNKHKRTNTCAPHARATRAGHAPRAYTSIRADTVARANSRRLTCRTCIVCACPFPPAGHHAGQGHRARQPGGRRRRHQHRRPPARGPKTATRRTKGADLVLRNWSNRDAAGHTARKLVKMQGNWSNRDATSRAVTQLVKVASRPAGPERSRQRTRWRNSRRSARRRTAGRRRCSTRIDFHRQTRARARTHIRARTLAS